MIQGGSAKVDDMIFRTNGSSWLVSFDEAGVLFSGNKLLTDTKYPPGLFWMAGSRKQADSLTEEEVSAIHPEAAVYAGSRLTKSYEDAEILNIWESLQPMSMKMECRRRFSGKNGN